MVFGPADFMASINMRSLVVGEQPPGYESATRTTTPDADPAGGAGARPAGDRRAVPADPRRGRVPPAWPRRTAALGFDGKWVLHPGQVEAANEVFTPTQGDYDHAELILDAYEHATTVAGGRGAVMLGDEMIDEASRKMALVVAAKGRAAGMSRTSSFRPIRRLPGHVSPPWRRGAPSASTAIAGAPTDSGRHRGGDWRSSTKSTTSSTASATYATVTRCRPRSRPPRCARRARCRGATGAARRSRAPPRPAPRAATGPAPAAPAARSAPARSRSAMDWSHPDPVTASPVSPPGSPGPAPDPAAAIGRPTLHPRLSLMDSLRPRHCLSWTVRDRPREPDTVDS